MEEGSVSGSEESDVEDTNMAHVADAILGNGYHQHANDAASLSHPEESAVGIPAEALESTALNISPEPCPSVSIPLLTFVNLTTPAIALSILQEIAYILAVSVL